VFSIFLSFLFFSSTAQNKGVSRSTYLQQQQHQPNKINATASTQVELTKASIKSELPQHQHK
jgi:hypothetical protein